MSLSKFTLAFGSLLFVSACYTPNAVPTGYTYIHQDYKQPLPKQSTKVNQFQRAHLGPEQAEQYRKALYDLTTKLTDRAGMPPKAVHVVPHDPMNAFYAQVDNDLREAMRHIGYTLATHEEDAYFFTYDAKMVKGTNGLDRSDGNIEIILKVMDSADSGAKLLTEQRGQYQIDGAEHYFGSIDNLVFKGIQTRAD